MSSKWLPILAASALVVVLTGCGGGASPPKPNGNAGGGGPAAGVRGNATTGRRVYMGTCMSCHGTDAKGLPGLGKNLVIKSDWMKQQTDDTLVAFIKTGRPATDPLNTTHVEMPPKGGNPSLTDDDLYDIVAYIRGLQKAAGQ